MRSSSAAGRRKWRHPQGAHPFLRESGLRFVSPLPELCSDNGAMIAWAGLERFKLG